MFLLSILILGIFCSQSDDLCKFKLPSGESIDVSNLPIMSVPLDDCYVKAGHRIEFHLCKSLEKSNCPSRDSDPPGNACDVYDNAKEFEWVGGFSNWDKGNYDSATQSFIMTYYGEEQKVTKFTRSLTVRMGCNPKLKDTPLVTCNGILDNQRGTFYNVQVDSKYACPKSGSAAAVVIPILLVLILLCCCCCCCLVLCVFGIIGVSAIGVGAVTKYTPYGEQVKEIVSGLMTRGGGYDTLGTTTAGDETENTYEDLSIPDEN